MKKLVPYPYLLLLFCFERISSQIPHDFLLLRYDEDYSGLKKDSTANWYTKIKHTSFSKFPNLFMTSGGEIRYQYFYYRNEAWGEAPQDKDGYLHNRCLAHVDVHYGKHFRTFGQLQSSMTNGKNSTSPVDENPLDLHQAFADYQTKLSETTTLRVRAGRQELSYGSQRLVSVRELPNNRQSFDGVKTVLTSANSKADLIYSHYVISRKGIADDRFDDQIKLWGGYFVRNNLVLLRNLDLYYLGIAKKEVTYDDASGKEIRHSVGTRIWNTENSWLYDLEGVYQWGMAGTNKILAWTVSANVAYTARVKGKHRFGIKSELISGDRHATDGWLNTFNPLFPRGAYFGLAALIGPSNLLDLHPYIELEINKKLTIKSDCDVFWRLSSSDGIYSPNVRLLYSGKTTSSKEIGQQLGVELSYKANLFLNFRLEFTWFNAGNYLSKVSSGKDIIMSGFTTQFKF